MALFRYGYDCKEQCWDSGLAHAKQFNVRKLTIVEPFFALMLFLLSTCASPWSSTTSANESGQIEGFTGPLESDSTQSYAYSY